MGLRSGARRALRIVVGLFVLSASALTAAADPPALIANWSGFYIGPHVGHAWAKPSYTFDTFIGPEHFSHDASDWFIGGHVGVQHQWNRLVAGVELSYSNLHLSDTAESRCCGNVSAPSTSSSCSPQPLASATPSITGSPTSAAATRAPALILGFS